MLRFAAHGPRPLRRIAATSPRPRRPGHPSERRGAAMTSPTAPQPYDPRRKPRRSLRYRLDKLSVYAPMLVMAALALATYWLSRSMPEPIAPQTIALTEREPDYRLHGFAVRSYRPDGQLTAEIFGSNGQHFPASDTLEVHNLRLRAITEDGRVLSATADTGASNGQGTYARLDGQAVVIQQASASAPRMEFRSAQLQVWPEEGRVHSDTPVQLLRGPDRLSGHNLRYDKQRHLTEIGGPVQATFLSVPRVMQK
ncbi:LPS export ABC transporter periplasmic protein LptC [Allofranklinella schreckenbergeri]|uniref:LPS export ABC transporter periplasmic protein LptC n=1 Tax=Allofranklinella schreckenbergeri TaxID=1076744 RepID=A0A3M6R2T6_9BURK|nr:LPS export ABC transporter periplasmic protein LptC [Allofranklinella schreckenbergeri]